MRKRRKSGDDDPITPKFGQLLKQARGTRELGTVVSRMHVMSPATLKFTRPQLERYEAGQRGRPDPVALFYLAKIYKADFLAWIEALADERALLVQAREQHDAAGESPPGARSARA